MRTNTYGGRDSVSVKWLSYGLDDQYNGHSRKAQEIFLFAQGIHIGRGQCTMGNISLTGHLYVLRRLRIRGAIMPLQRISSGYVLNYSTGTTFRLLNLHVGLYAHKCIRVCYLYV